MYAGEQVGIDDVFRSRGRDHLLVALDRIGFGGGDEGGADIGKVGAQYARGADGAAVCNRARQRDRTVEPGPRLRHEGQRRNLASMAAGAGRDQDQTVGALFDRLVRKFLVDHVVENDAAPAMRGLIEFLARAERGDHHRHLVLFTKRQILIEPVVRLVHDLVHRKRCRRPRRVGLVVSRELFLDPRQPFVEQRRRPGVQRRKRAHHTRLALRDHQIRHGNDEERRTDHGERQTALEQGRHGHSKRSFGLFKRVRHRRRDAGHHTNKAIFPVSSIAFWRYWQSALVT